MSLNYKFKHSYQVHYRHDDVATHHYIVECAQGAVHLRVTDYGERWHEKKYYSSRYTSGLEFYYRNPPSHMRVQAPDHSWVLNAPCWHDGTSLYAEEHYTPLIESGLSPTSILNMLEGEIGRLSDEEEDDHD